MLFAGTGCSIPEDIAERDRRFFQVAVFPLCTIQLLRIFTAKLRILCRSQLIIGFSACARNDERGRPADSASSTAVSGNSVTGTQKTGKYGDYGWNTGVEESPAVTGTAITTNPTAVPSNAGTQTMANDSENGSTTNGTTKATKTTYWFQDGQWSELG